MNFKKSIWIFGSGKVASNIAEALHYKKYSIEKIISRNQETGEELCLFTDAEYSSEFKSCKKFNGIVFFCLSDTGLQEIAPQLQFPRALVMHTSGSQPLSILQNCSPYSAVFYPLMSFTRDFPEDITNAPIFVEYENPIVKKAVFNLANSLSDNVFKVNSEQRAHLHLAGVIANNFSNYLYGIAGEIVTSQGFSRDVLNPIMKKTVDKLLLNQAHDNQTGPAIRNDTVVIEKNLALLADQPLIQDIYRILTKGIQEKAASKFNKNEQIF
jgi:predicted short-subunit dehydrogenase-like oxidoreductase (DUF2520 family)